MGMEINVDYISAGVTDLAGNLLLHETREQDNRIAHPAPWRRRWPASQPSSGTARRPRGSASSAAAWRFPGSLMPRPARSSPLPTSAGTSEALDLGALLPDVPLGTTLFNEANAAALAELRYRPAGGADFLFVSGEVGVGGGLVIGSELFTGPHGPCR